MNVLDADDDRVAILVDVGKGVLVWATRAGTALCRADDDALLVGREDTELAG
jgi:hypothetical protein